MRINTAGVGSRELAPVERLEAACPLVIPLPTARP